MLLNVQYRIRSLILQEYQAGRTEYDAHEKICKEHGPKAMSIATVKNWYKKFEAGELYLRNKKKKDREHTYKTKPLFIEPDGRLMINKTILFEWYDDQPRQFETIDGRSGFDFRDGVFTVADFFHGRLATFSADDEAFVPFPSSCVCVLQDSRILLLETTEHQEAHEEMILLRVSLISLDFDTLKFRFVSQADKLLTRAIDTYDLLLDQSDASFFGIVTQRGLMLGEIEGNTISIGDYRANTTGRRLECLKLVGSMLSALQTSVEPGNFNLITYDLQSMTTRTVKVPSILSNGLPLDKRTIADTHYVWAGSVLYIRWDGAREPIYRLDADVGTWSKLDFVVGPDVCMMAVSDDVLTIQTDQKRGPGGKTHCATFYRFQLRRPDSLINLAWFSARYHHNFRGSAIYKRLRNRLPYNSYLRCPFPDEV